MIGRRLINGKAEELFKGYSIVDLGFQLRVGVDPEPLLKEEALHEDQGRIGLVSLGAFADGIISHDQPLDGGPIDDGVDLFHSLDSRFFSKEEKREISAKEKLLSIFLKPIDPPG
jgi:hypothetical protein